MAAVAASLVLLPAPVASGRAVQPELATTGPADSGRLSFGEDPEAYVLAASLDGERVVFGSNAPMTSDDRSSGFDLFERVGQTTRLLATPSRERGSDVRVIGASQDATRIVFASHSPWTDDDRDAATDIFAIEGGRVERLSTGPGESSDGTEAHLTSVDPVELREPISGQRKRAGISPDARRVLFTTYERLTPDDTDEAIDVYVHDGERTTKVSPGNDDRWHAGVAGHSTDARRVVLGTQEPLTPDDRDGGGYDYFLREGDTTVKLSPGDGGAGAGEYVVGVSGDGRTALLRTRERLTPGDGDAVADYYLIRAGGSPALVTNGPDDERNDGPTPSGRDRAFLTSDGERVAFTSDGRHTPDDTDEQLDTFLWTPERIVKVGRGNGETGPPVEDSVYPGEQPLSSELVGASRDASRLVVTSFERLTADDRDDRPDLFEADMRTGDVRRVTTGPSGGNDPTSPRLMGITTANLVFSNADASRLVFQTPERLVPEEDTDSSLDVYQRAGGVTTLLSPSPPGITVDTEALWVAGAADGSVGYVRTREQLTEDDRNPRYDGYRVRPPAPGVGAPDGVVPPEARGDRPTGDKPTAGDPVAPRLSVLTRRGARLRLRPGALRLQRTGAGLRFSLSRAVPLTVRLERARAGRLARGRCRPPSTELRRRRGCTRFVTVAPARTFAPPAGRQVLVLGSRLIGGARLRPGRHRLTLTPRGGRPVRVTLTLLR